MSGATLAMLAVAGQGVDWADISGETSGSNADQTIPWTTTITVSFGSPIGTGNDYYVLNGGAVTQYTVPFAVIAGDTLHWEAQTKGGYQVTNSVYRTGSILIDTYHVLLTG